MLHRSCAYKGCGNTENTNKDVSYFRYVFVLRFILGFSRLCNFQSSFRQNRFPLKLPPNQKLLSEWLKVIDKSKSTAFNWRFLCSDHFRKEDIITFGENRRGLTAKATPVPLDGQPITSNNVQTTPWPIPRNTSCDVCNSTGKRIAISLQFSSEKAENARRIIAQHFHNVLVTTDLPITFVCCACWRIILQFHALYDGMLQRCPVKTTTTVVMSPAAAAAADAVEPEQEEEDHLQQCAVETVASPAAAAVEPPQLEEEEYHDVKVLLEDSEETLIDLDDGIEFIDVDREHAALMKSLLGEGNNTSSATGEEIIEPSGHDDDDATETEESPAVALLLQPNHHHRLLVPLPPPPPQKPSRLKVKVTAALNAHIRAHLKSMSCELCDTEFECVSHVKRHVKRHYRKQHQRQGYLRCCDAKHFALPDLLRHIERVHLLCAFSATFGAAARRIWWFHVVLV